LARPVVARCAALTAGTEQVASEWKGLVENVDVVPLGVETNRFKPKNEKARPGSPGRIGYLGRLVPGKGVDVLVRAAASGGDWELVIDDGPGRGPLQDLVRNLDLDNRVRFSLIEYEEVPEFLQSLDILVLPSRTTPRWREQFGRVLIEAMATGTPVIGSSSGSIPGVVGEAGLIFPEGDHEALAAAISHLLDDAQLWVSLRQAGLDRAQDFSWEAVARRTAHVYDRVTSS
jgi:glycosyltransferase involved in cell wall biosynthesis